MYEEKDYERQNRKLMKKMQLYLNIEENHRKKISDSIDWQIKAIEMEILNKNVDFLVSRGEIWLMDLGYNCANEMGKERPCIVVSYDEFNNKSGLVTVVPITRARYSHPTQFVINDECIKYVYDKIEGTAKAEQITTKAKCRLRTKIGELSERGIEKLEAALINHLCLTGCCTDKALEHIGSLEKELSTSKVYEQQKQVDPEIYESEDEIYNLKEKHGIGE